jgi:serine protease Do
VAVGNPFGLGGTVTAGIVSARGRDIGAGPYDDFLQIDAPVNRGNSGGPTFDATGQVVGVNSAIFSPSGGSVGIGFAIPAEVAKDVVASLKDKGVVARGYIGVQIQPVTQDIADSLGLKSAKGALVAEAKSGPAADAGIKSGDVIVAVNGERIDGPRELARKIAALGPDKKVELTYSRGGAEKTAEVKLGQLPNEREARADTSKSDGAGSLTGLGVALAPASAVPGAGKTGVVVADVDPDGVAAQKGLRPGDVILEAAGKPVSSPADVSAALAGARHDGQKALLLRVKTGDATRFVAIATKAS